MSFGLTGLGGYAGWICDQMIARSESDPAASKLTAVCESDLHTHKARADRLRSVGVTVVSRLDELLALPVEAVWLPLPIDLHRPFTEKCLKAGKAVLVEKPAAGSVEDVDAMIAARDRHQLPVGVGFQNLYDPATWAIKQKLVDGAIGKPLRASVVACWPRGDAYFNRTSWAGKMKRNGTWVLDSPANNAMAHFLNLALFLLGPTLTESASPLEVHAELYRVNSIENYDTCCLRYTVEGGVTLLVNLTHACLRTVQPTIEIVGQLGAVRFANGSRFELSRTSAGHSIATTDETIPVAPHQAAMVAREFSNYLHSDRKSARIA